MSITLKIINNFNSTVQNGTDYFNNHYNDDEIWLFFLNTSGKITYKNATTKATTTVPNASSIQLSTIEGGTLTLATGESSTKLFAGLGTSNPFSGVNGPGVFDTNVPYALAEWTINGNSNDNVDISYIDSFSFPTVATVTDSSGTQMGKSGFVDGTKAADIITAFKTLIATNPVGPNNSQMPSAGQVGFGPEVPTINGNSSANRWVGSSKFYISAPDASKNRSMYIYAPSFQAYLKYLKENKPTTVTNSGSVTGWYIDYSGNNGYSGYLSITGDETSGYGLEVNNIRVNTKPSAANNWEADPNAGSATTGKITVVANNSTIDFTPVAGNTVEGLWTDAVIYSGAALVGNIGTGPVVIGTGDFAPGGGQNGIVATFLASISASITTGLLGSQMYIDGYTKTKTNPAAKATMYWFNTLSREDSLTKLFGSAWSDKGTAFYDPFWAVLAGATYNQGYLSPFNDRWSNFSPDLPLTSGATIQWELGLIS